MGGDKWLVKSILTDEILSPLRHTFKQISRFHFVKPIELRPVVFLHEQNPLLKLNPTYKTQQHRVQAIGAMWKGLSEVKKADAMNLSEGRKIPQKSKKQRSEQPPTIHLPFTSPLPPLYLPFTSPLPPLYLPFTSPLPLSTLVQ